MSRTQLIAGNWKMNGLREQMMELRTVGAAVGEGRLEGCEALICPPATILTPSRAILPTAVSVGGQDCHFERSGAFTGDLSAAMLADAGAGFVILGHSERRSGYDESDALVNRKCRAAWSADLVALICIGETDDERDAGATRSTLERQLAGSLPDGATAENTVVAYEPVWAIGSGRMPDLDDIESVHGALRASLANRFGASFGEAVRILYGGSVKPSNAGELLAISDVDGVLVGGASLKADDFLAICDAARRV